MDKDIIFRDIYFLNKEIYSIYRNNMIQGKISFFDNSFLNYSYNYEEDIPADIPTEKIF